MIRRIIALPVWWLCSAVDWLPHHDSIDHRWYRHGGYGCYPLHISELALRIEGRW